MDGCVVYNGFWNPEGPPDAARRLVRAGEALGVSVAPIPNTALTAVFDGGVRVAGLPEGCRFALFWDKDVRLARTMEAAGLHLYNTADAVAVCDDKAATHLALAAQGIPMPHTLVAPMTYTAMTPTQSALFLERGAAMLGFPLVVKECYGSLGGQVSLARDMDGLRQAVDKMAAHPFLLQAFVASSAGEDMRLYVVGGRVAAAMRRHSDTDFRANIGGGGQGSAYAPTPAEEALALRCCRILDVPIAGVDLLRGADGEPLVCEVNSCAQMAAITACTGINVAEDIVRYVLTEEIKKN